MHEFCASILVNVRFPFNSAVSTQKCGGGTGDFGCYGADIVSHDPPLVYDLTTSEGLSEETTYTGPELASVISQVQALVSTHTASIVKPASEIDKGGKSKTLPCCDIANSCVCNYP